MNLPKQAAPVQRNLPSAALSTGSGVEASISLEDILGTVSTIASVAAPLLGGLI